MNLWTSDVDASLGVQQHSNPLVQATLLKEMMSLWLQFGSQRTILGRHRHARQTIVTTGTSSTDSVYFVEISERDSIGSLDCRRVSSVPKNDVGNPVQGIPIPDCIEFP